MKTRCPGCNTTFRVTPEQIRARAGKVRCGKCATAFNALDSLLEEAAPPVAANPDILLEWPAEPEIAEEALAELVDAAEPSIEALPETPAEPIEAIEPMSEAAVQSLARESGLILPRETTEIPGYSKWIEGGISSPASPSARNTRWPFTLSAFLLALALGVQIVFHFRSEIAIAAPALRPALQALSEALDSSIPLPRHADLINIETSDLQADPLRSDLLVLHATLRNRAPYAQAYPLFELTLTDTQDSAIARRVFLPDQYLPPQRVAAPAFPANTDIAVRLPLELKEISAAGYRLYVFYP
ncbi:MAG: DUF3426 domain-containing protein [Rhodocyclaceae bacterium]